MQKLKIVVLENDDTQNSVSANLRNCDGINVIGSYNNDSSLYNTCLLYTSPSPRDA